MYVGELLERNKQMRRNLPFKPLCANIEHKPLGCCRSINSNRLMSGKLEWMMHER